jgi:hypothetical protein
MPSPSLLQLEANVAAANEQLGRKFGTAYHPARVVPFTWGLQPEGAAAESAALALAFAWLLALPRPLRAAVRTRSSDCVCVLLMHRLRGWI